MLVTPKSRKSLPSGVLTFCLTDIEDSSMHWDRDAAAMATAVARQQSIVGGAVEANGGVLILAQGEGDSTVSVFVSPRDAVRAATEMQRALREETWSGSVALRVRIGLNTGEAEQRDGTYYGSTLNRAGRIRALAGGGQTFLSRATAELAEDDPPEGTVIRPLGLVELRGLSRAEQIHAVELEGEEPTSRLSPPEQPNLPVMLTTFVGRSGERAKLHEALASSRVVTSTGPGGSGKTRLAVEVAHDIADLGLQRLWLVDLAPIADGGLVAETVASTIAAADELEAAVDRIVAAVGARDAVLVLDNCEHVARACADLVAALVGRCPGLRVLATSQVPLRVSGETVVPLPPLALPSENATAETIATAEAVQLIADRARRHDPTFELTDANLSALADVCRLLDGLPLALELAAAHLRLLTPDQMLERLGADRFRLLSRSGSATEARHQALAETLEWSYGLLSEKEQLLLNRLSIFSGGFTLPAAEAICASDQLPAEEVYETLAELAARSLVAHRTRAGQMRYWLLETIREYAIRKLEATSPAPCRWTIRKEGQYWTLESSGAPVRLRHSKGLGYLATLLERPNREVHVLELASPGAAAPTGTEDDLLDGAAIARYRERLVDLTSERDDALAANDSERAVRAELELEALTNEITASTGLGGKSRKTAGATERARMSVTKALRGAIEKVLEQSAEVGAHLDRSVRTGAQCVYRPDDGHQLRLD